MPIRRLDHLDLPESRVWNYRTGPRWAKMRFEGGAIPAGSDATMVQTLQVTLEPGRTEPIFQQIADAIASRIRTGALPAHARLPPTRDLAASLGTHRGTVVRAYDVLTEAGFVISHVGRGTFVADTLLPPSSTPTSRAEPTPTVGLAWASLLSRTASAEPLRRGDRLARQSPRPDAIDLSRFQPALDLRPDDALRRCLDHVLRTQGPKALGYAPREGVRELRVAIAQDLVRRGIPATESQVVVTSGSQQALDWLARAFVDPGDAFLVEEPTYSGVLNLLSAAGARPVGVPGDREGPDPEALARLGRPGTKGFYLMPNGSNPTGRTMSLERRRAVVAWSRRAGIPIIEDDYGADMYLDQPPPPALRALDGQVLHVGTFSKKLAPALRIGFLVAPEALHDHLVPLKHAMDLGSSALLQAALAEFMDRGYLAAHTAKIRAAYRERRDALVEALEAHLPRAVTWEQPTAGVLLWLRLPEGLDSESVFDLAHRHGVLVSPGTVNSVNGQGAGGLRLAFCTETPDRLREGARRLGRAIEEALSLAKTRGPRLELV